MEAKKTCGSGIALDILAPRFSACKLSAWHEAAGMVFQARAQGELSLICETAHAPSCCIAREDGWRGLRVRGKLDFSLVGILSGLTSALAKARIPVMAVSTFDTDYLFVKASRLSDAVDALRAAGYTVCAQGASPV